MKKTALLFATLVLALVTASTWSANVDLGAGAATGRVDLKSIGPLAFGPDGILFVADSLAASIFALDTQDTEPVHGPDGVAIDDLDGQVAALLGTTTDQVRILDLAVNPKSHRIYLSVMRGQGEAATPLILRTTADGPLERVALDEIRYSRAVLSNAPDSTTTNRRGQSLRLETNQSAMQSHDGRLTG